MECSALLRSNTFFQQRRCHSLLLLDKLRDAAADSPILMNPELSVFVAGSIGRLEAGDNSDIDLFPVTRNEKLAASYLETCRVVAELARVNTAMDAPPFSNDGRFLRLYQSKQLTARTGYDDDDSGNHFTTRMLLILEGRPAINKEVVREIRGEVAEHYFRDRVGKKTFRPLFLVNDILRYWRTLCLNYEIVRTEARPWRKKNINLKFSRMITVFGSVLPILVQNVDSPDKLINLCELTPLERFAQAIDSIGDDSLSDDFSQLLHAYERFLTWKDHPETEGRLDELREDIRSTAEVFATYIHRALTHETVPTELRRYLVI